MRKQIYKATYFLNKGCLRPLLIALLWLPAILYGRPIETFYGPVEVEEPVLLELIDAPSFQRLKLVHQYGVAYYTTHKEEYNRYDHSLGVFALLRLKGASMEEQIAGLLHDVSHTAFSHVGDWIFGKENQDGDYQGTIHALCIEKTGLGAILEKYGFQIDQIIPEEDLFPALENSLPNLCADRIDYNIQGAYYQGFITREEAISIFQDLQFIQGRWVSQLPDLMKKLTRSSLFMTQDCWGSPTNYVLSRWFADAILKGIEIKLISFEELHFGTDQPIWDKLMQSTDPFIAYQMKRILDSHTYISIGDFSNADFIIKSRFRGIDPWILVGENCVRLTSLDSSLAEEYENIKERVNKGWPVQILSD